MSKRYEKRPVRVEKELEVSVITCDECGTEIATSRNVYFGAEAERLVLEGEDEQWLAVQTRQPKTSEYPGKPEYDFCSKACLIQWASRVEVTAS